MLPRCLASAALPLGLVACTATSGGPAPVVSPQGEPLGQAQVAYVTHGGATAQMTVTLPDGESFTGPALSLRETTEPGPGLLLGQGDPALLVASPGATWTGEIEAELASPRGAVMTCRLREARPGLGLEGGASGRCTLPDGRALAVRL